MSSKQDTQATPAAGPQTLKIGSRVRCADDRVEGRIVWANGVAVKVRWDDGEQVTWRRDSLSSRPIEILAAAADEKQPASPLATPELADRIEPPQAGPETHRATEPTTDQAATPAPAPPPAESASPVPEPMEAETGPAPGAQAEASAQREGPAPAGPKEKKLSALNAAAKVLGEAGRPMSCPELIAAMAAQGYWASPAGRTPASTLYAAILRELKSKGERGRFQKAERGKFALATAG